MQDAVIKARCIVDERIEYIDVAKAIGLILVILSHSAYPALMLWSTPCFIPLFFFCSGYTQRGKISLKKRARKLLIPYLIFNAAYIMLAFCTGRLAATNIYGVFYGSFSLYKLSYPDNILFLNIGNGPTWFLISLFVSSILFKLLISSGKSYTTFLLLVTYLALSIFFSKIDIILPLQLSTAFFFATVMWGGYYTNSQEDRQTQRYPPRYLILALLVTYLIVLLYNGDDENLSVAQYGNSVLLSLIGGLSGSVLIITLSKFLIRTRFKDIFIHINKYGLSLFCIQMPLIIASGRIAHLGLAPFGNSSMIMCISAMFQTLFTLVIGYHIAKWLHKFCPNIF